MSDLDVSRSLHVDKMMDLSKELTNESNLVEKAYFNPTQAASFSSAQSLRKHLLSQKRPMKRGKHIKVPSL